MQMEKGRIEIFSDNIFAITITIKIAYSILIKIYKALKFIIIATKTQHFNFRYNGNGKTFIEKAI